MSLSKAEVSIRFGHSEVAGHCQNTVVDTWEEQMAAWRGRERRGGAGDLVRGREVAQRSRVEGTVSTGDQELL